MIPAILAALGEAGVAGGAAEGAGAAGAAAGMGNLTKNLGQLETVASRLNPSMQKFVGAITALPNQVLAAKAAITQTFDTFVQALAAPLDTIKHLGDSISRFVRLSNPAVVTMFEYRVENAFASIGKILEPILVALGHAADKANEAFNKLAPAFQPLVDATTEVIESVADGLVPAFRELAPLIKLSGETTHALVAGIKGLAQAGVATIPGFQTLTGLLRRLVGGVDEEGGKSVAARQVRLSSVEEIQREGAKRSIMATLASEQGGQKPATTEGILQQILTFLNTHFSKEAMIKILLEVAAQLKKLVPDVPRVPLNGAMAIHDVIQFLRGKPIG